MSQRQQAIDNQADWTLVDAMVFDLKQKLTQSSWYKTVRIRRLLTSHLPPILIFQVGKVGSYAIYCALRRLKLAQPVLHVHWLSDVGIAREESLYGSVNALGNAKHLIASHAIRRRMHRNPSEKWTLITLVREPIGRSISTFFERVPVFWPYLLDDTGALKVEDARAKLVKQLTSNDPELERTNTWFDTEMKGVFGIDVYEHPFDHRQGSTVIETERARVLLIRMEDINRNTSVLQNFLALNDPLRLEPTNVARDKPLGDGYRTIRRSLNLNKDLCIRYYSSHFARHFYTEYERSTLIEKWSGNSISQVMVSAVDAERL